MTQFFTLVAWYEKAELKHPTKSGFIVRKRGSRCDAQPPLKKVLATERGAYPPLKCVQFTGGGFKRNKLRKSI